MTKHHFTADADEDMVRMHLLAMAVNDEFTIDDLDNLDAGPWRVRRYSIDDWQYTPVDGRTRIGSEDEVMTELFPSDYAPTVATMRCRNGRLTRFLRRLRVVWSNHGCH